MTLACFISPHGFGHAARTCAILSALAARRPHLHAIIFTRVPEWFFAESLACSYDYVTLETDVGMAQHSALVEDVPATLARLDALWPPRAALLDDLAQRLQAAHGAAVLCDISPLGILAARAAGLPSVLVENFTWDWIYDGYAAVAPRMRYFAASFGAAFMQATYRIQTTPVCVPRPATLTVAPVSRAPRASRAATRRALGLAPAAPVILLTNGGVETQLAFQHAVRARPAWHFVVPTSRATRMQREGNCTLLPWQSAVYHPDIVRAADVVVGKLGYSTIAEVYHAGGALAYFTRPQFRESAVMADFVRATMPAVELPPASFETGAWLEAVPALLAARRPPAPRANGAAAAAALLATLGVSQLVARR
jgi:hypothetical protein